MNHKRIQWICFALLFLLIGWMNVKEIPAEETTVEEVVTLEETTEEITTEPTESIEPTTEENTTEVPLRQEEVTKIPTEYKPPKKDNDTVAIDKNTTVVKSVVTLVSFLKKGKKRAKLYVYSEGDYKTKKTKVIVKIQIQKKGKWTTYRIIQKTKKSFYCVVKKKLRLKGNGKYRADITVHYYNKKNKRIGKHRKKSKTILT